MSKYHNRKVTFGNLKFDSVLEYEYYLVLCQKQESGYIKDFQMQVPFILLDGYEIDGRKVRPIKLIADFVIEYDDGKIEVHDTKGMVKPIDTLKKKMFESKFKQPLIFIGKSIIDGGFVDHEIIKEGRKKRKQLKLSKK